MNFKRMFKIVPLLFLNIVGSIGFAQSTRVFDYGPLSISNSCNAFASNGNIGGRSHFLVKGRVFYDVSEGAISLVGKLSGGVYKGSEFMISDVIPAGHNIRVTVRMRELLNPTGSSVVVGLYNSANVNPPTACAPEALSTSYINSNLFYVYTDVNYHDYVWDLTTSSYTNAIGVKAYTTQGYATNNTFDIGTYIQRITIEDFTPVYDFSISSSSASRTCGADMLAPIDFTVNNLNNAPNVTYEFSVLPNQWTLGFSNTIVTAPIVQSQNTISLKPFACQGGSVLTVTPRINGVAQPPVTKTITINYPSYQISGSAVLNGQSGLYYLQNAGTGTAPTPPCAATTAWSIDNATLATLYVNGTYNVGVGPKSGGFGGTNGTVILTAKTSMCENYVTTTKSINVSMPSGFGSVSRKVTSSEDLQLNVSPNPSNGIFELTFNKFLSEADLVVTSIEGRSVVNKKVIGLSSQVDISTFPSGIYLIKLSEKGNTVVQKIIKN